MSDLQAGLDAYRRQVDAFRWQVPDAFNFGRDVVDRFAADPERPALCWRGADSGERRLGFAEVSRASNRFAHLLRALGVAAGDPVIVMLPRVPEWQIASVGARETTASPEYEDLRRAAVKAGVPLKEMHRRIVGLFRTSEGG